jgi:hypothetical protein
MKIICGAPRCLWMLSSATSYWRLEMSTERDDTEAAMGTLYGELLIAFREAKENGLTWYNCEAVAETANAEVFPDTDIEAERRAALKAVPF